jgi:hypothetical protein
MNLDIKLVPPKQVPSWVPGLRPYLKKSEFWTKGRAQATDIIEYLMDGRMNLWAVVDPDDFTPYGYVITEFRDYARCRALVIQYCAGENNYMRHVEDQMYDTLERFARDGGCEVIEFFGRKGWEKHVKSHGYDMNMVIYEKFLGANP